VSKRRQGAKGDLATYRKAPEKSPVRDATGAGIMKLGSCGEPDSRVK
jgi:hypothetical protein